MKKLLTGAAATAAAITFATAAFAAGPPYCGTAATPSITAPSTGVGAQCQAAITKNTQKYLKTYLKTYGKCLSSGGYADCPNAADDTKVQGAAAKASTAIAAACGDTSGLGTSYAAASGENAASCTLSQNHGTAEIFVGETHGVAISQNLSAPEITCQQGINKAAQKFLPSILKTVDKCIGGRIKKGDTTGLGAACVGSLSAAGLASPTDDKVTASISKAVESMGSAVAKSCGGLSAAQISELFSCPGATTLGDLTDCVKCSGFNSLFELVGQQYAENGSVVTPGTNAIQTAVDAGSAGDKFLIASGDYTESVVVPAGECSVSATPCNADKVCDGSSPHPGSACFGDQDCTPTSDPGHCIDACPMGETCQSAGDGMAFVGCGAATDDRPKVFPPLMGAGTRGFLANGVDGLHFESIEVDGWSQDGIFVSGAEGVSFRDILGNGDDVATPSVVDPVMTYAVFPVKSDNVVVEGCDVLNVRDAGIYVGQSHNIVMRHNYVWDCVAGMEIENSEGAQAYGNVTHDNTGGLLTFKLTGPEKQTSGGHHVFDNVSYSNNVANFGIPGTTVAAVPRGTGMMSISEDNSIFENNIIEKNDTYGFLILDQDAINTLVGPPPLFSPTSVDQASENLQFLNNRMFLTTSSRGNGGHPDMDALFAGNWTWAINTGPNGSCWKPAPTATASATLGVSSFPACP